MSVPKRQQTDPPPKGRAKTAKSAGGKPIRVPQDLYDDLLRLQGVYPGMTLMELAALKLRKGMEGDEAVLTELRRLQRTPPK